MFTDPNNGTTTVARTSGGNTYSLVVDPSVPIGAMNGVDVYFRGTTCEGTPLTLDAVAYGTVLPPPGTFGAANELFAADTLTPIVAVGAGSATDSCSSPEALSKLYLWDGKTSHCSAVSLCGPMRPLKSMGVLDTTPPYTLRLP